MGGGPVQAGGQARGAIQVFAAPRPEPRALQAGSADSEAPLQEGTEGQGLRQTGRWADVCHLPPIKGVCNYKRERWFFDPKTKSCKSLIFMGCGGYNINNNFERKWLCERTCR
ncbi:Collagen type VI alpha 3 chain [Crotalus adamanteus]|uniref:Collagen type VI alpha 3 chain n=1 Tax=Crotalus adamanteus TaxID=8729 RepID=A0AAW1BSV4_CROAD